MNTVRLGTLALVLAACSSGGGGYGYGAGKDMSVRVPFDGGWGMDFARPSGDGGGSCHEAGLDCSRPCCAPAVCRDGLCAMATTCKPANAACAPGDTCCNGLVCNGLHARCEACGTVGGGCATSADCCGGLSCGHGAACVKPQTCASDGQACAAGGDCCGGFCNGFDKICGSCGSSINANCQTNDDCCGNSNWTCNLDTHKCQQPMMGCKGQGKGCAHTVDCCQGLYCDAGQCTAAPMCKAIGAACGAYTDCCESVSMDCVATKCCIEKLYQDPSTIRCYADGDCCSGETCVAGACQ